jgi:lipoic acid synthetase
MSFVPTRDRVSPEEVNTTPLRRPDWIKVRAPSGEVYEKLHTLMRAKSLHTVCEEAMCPNMGECWNSGAATFLMMGSATSSAANPARWTDWSRSAWRRPSNRWT